MTSRVILAVAAVLGAAALNLGCYPEPLVPGNPGAAGMNGAAGTTGRAGMNGLGGNLTGGAGASGGINGTYCGITTWPAQPVPPDILILLDASGSMNDDTGNNTCNGGCGASSKWAQATSAINSVVAESDASIRWSLKFFADTDVTCGVGSGVAVSVGSGNASAIAGAITGRTSGNGGVSNGSRTPTRAAVTAGAAYLQGLTDMSPRVLLLVTDGEPNCMPGNVDSAADDSAGAIAAVTDAYTAGFATMVIGVSTGAEPTDTTLRNLAVAGGYARAASPPYYPVSSAAELTTALHALIDRAPSCMLALPQAPSGTAYPRIGVVVGGTEIPRDTTHTGGWDFTNSTQTAIELYGQLCDDLRTGKATSVQIVFYCPIG